MSKMKNFRFLSLTIIFSTTATLSLSMGSDDEKTLCTKVQDLKLDDSGEKFINSGASTDLLPLIASLLPTKLLQALKNDKPFRKALLTHVTYSGPKESNVVIAAGAVYNLLDQNMPDKSFLDEQYMCQLIQSHQKRNPIIPLKRFLAKGISKERINFSNNPFLTPRLLDAIITILINANLHTNIKSVRLQNCNLESLSESIGHFINLKELDLRDNPQLSVQDLQHIQDILPNTTLIVSIPMSLDE